MSKFIVTKTYQKRSFIILESDEPPTMLTVPYRHNREFETWKAKREAKQRRSPEPIIMVWKLEEEFRP